jgi:hypothetical protein
MLVVVSARHIGRLASSLLVAAVWAWTLVCSPVTLPGADGRGEGSIAPSHRAERYPATKTSEFRPPVLDRSVDQAATFDVVEPLCAAVGADLLLPVERRATATPSYRFAHSARGPPVRA